MTRITELLQTHAWAIQDGWLKTIHGIASRQNDVKALAAELGHPLEFTRDVQMRDGVAIIPVIGPLFPRANLFTEISSATSIDILALDFNAAQSDDDVKATVLVFDSPGGVVTHINEMANMINAAEKPVIAYVSGSAGSAAYYLAAAADEIVIDAMGLAGSIGVVTEIFKSIDDDSIEFVSSHAPDKRPDISTESGRLVVQSRIDVMETVFMRSVATFRNLTVESLQALKGNIFVGQDAINVGLADRLGSLESVIKTLQKTHQTTGNTMDITQLKADHPALYQSVTAEATAAMDSKLLDRDQQLATLKTESQTIAATAVQQERQRMNDILDSEEAKGRYDQARHIAFKTDMSVDDAKEMLLATPAKAQDSGQLTPFELAMKQQGNPDIDPEPGADEADPAMAIINAGKQAGLAFN